MTDQAYIEEIYEAETEFAFQSLQKDRQEQADRDILQEQKDRERNTASKKMK